MNDGLLQCRKLVGVRWNVNVVEGLHWVTVEFGKRSMCALMSASCLNLIFRAFIIFHRY